MSPDPAAPREPTSDGGPSAPPPPPPPRFAAPSGSAPQPPPFAAPASPASPSSPPPPPPSPADLRTPPAAPPFEQPADSAPAGPAPGPPPGTTRPPTTTASSDHDLADILSRLDAEEDVASSSPAPERRDTSAPAVGTKLTDPRDLTRPSAASGIVVDVGAGIEFDPSFATFGQRAAGAIVDALVVAIALLPAVVLLPLADGAAGALLALLVGAIGLGVVVVLGARAIASNGKWIGNRVADTTVVDAINGSFVDPGRAGLRMLGRHLLSPILLLGYLVAFTDSERRTFHDRLAGTVVIRRPREVWTADDA